MSRKYNFDEIISRENTNSAKYDAGTMLNEYLPSKHIPMWVADMDFACPQPILDAMKARLDKRILGYSMPLDANYYMAVLGWMKRRHDWDVEPLSIVFTSGVITALNKAVEQFTKPGEGVILHTPGYHPFEDAVLKNGRVPAYSPLINTDGYYTIDFDDLEKKAKDPNNTLFFLCNPQNPSGRVWKEEELRRIGEICFANNVFVVSDEIHSDLLRRGQKHIPFAKLFPQEKRLITCTAPSKTFNLAGNHLGNVIIPDKEIATEWLMGTYCGTPNPLSVDACIAAYNECEDWLEELKDYLDGNFTYVKDFLDRELPEAKFRIPEGTYVAWVDLSAFGYSDEQLKKAISRAGLFIEYGNEFIGNAEGFVRMNLACPRATIEKAMGILVKALRQAEEYLEDGRRLEAGEKMPDFSYDTPFEKDVSIKEGVAGKKTMLLFLRYFGCTVCQLDMMLLKEEYDQILATGGQVKVVLQSDPQSLASQLVGENTLPYDIICDPERKLYRKFAINPARSMLEMANAETMAKIGMAQAKGLVHGAYEGEELQLPAAFVVDGELNITYAHYAKGLADLPDVPEIVELLKV